MRKAILLAIPAIAIIALVGYAAAQPFLWTSPQNMSSSEKSLQVQMLDQKAQFIQDQKDYLNGAITQAQYQQKIDAYQQSMLTLMQQMRDALQSDPNFQNVTASGGCPLGGYRGAGAHGAIAAGVHMGRGMMGRFW